MSHDLFKNHLSNATHNFDVLENKSYALVTLAPSILIISQLLGKDLIQKECWN